MVSVEFGLSSAHESPTPLALSPRQLETLNRQRSGGEMPKIWLLISWPVSPVSTWCASTIARGSPTDPAYARRIYCKRKPYVGRQNSHYPRLKTGPSQPNQLRQQPQIRCQKRLQSSQSSDMPSAPNPEPQTLSPTPKLQITSFHVMFMLFSI